MKKVLNELLKNIYKKGKTAEYKKPKGLTPS